MSNQSRLYLLKGVTLDPNYETSIDFANKAMQKKYFEGFPKVEHDSNLTYSYLRSNEAIDVPFKYEDLAEVNYLYYINDNKVFYNFITRKEFINNNLTRLYIELDVFQTYMFDYELGECFVEREHQDRVDENKDFIFNVEDEGIELGSTYVLENVENLSDNDFPSSLPLKVMWYYIWASDRIDNTAFIDSIHENILTYKKYVSTRVNDVPTNMYCYAIPYIEYGGLPVYELRLRYLSQNYRLDNSSTGYRTAEILLSKLSEDKVITSIQVSRIAPFDFDVERIEGSGVIYYDILPKVSSGVTQQIFPCEFDNPNTTSSKFYAILVNNQDNIQKLLYNGENIKETNSFDIVGLGLNKDISREPKLLTNPYRFYSLKYADSELKLLPQLFSGAVQIKGFKSVLPSSTTMLFPINYAESSLGKNNELFSVGSNEVPLRTDSWVQYYQNNKASLRTGMLTKIGVAGATLAIGLATGGIGLAVAATSAIGTAGSIINELQQRQDIKESPDNLRATGDDIGVKMFLDNLYGEFETYTIQQPYKNKAFGFFYRLGYAVRAYKTPNTKSRYYFNFIKTTECVLKTNKVSAGYAEAIKDIYNKGITIWHYRDEETFSYMDYNLENWEMKLIGGNE